MKISPLIILATSLVASNAYAEAPVLDNSTTYNSSLLKPVAADTNYRLTIRVNKLQRTVANLQEKVKKLEKNRNITSSKAKKGSSAAKYPAIKGVPSSQKQSYTNAYNLLRARKTNSAISAFQKIIRDNPKGRYAPNAQYWLGEAYLRKGQKNVAMQAFDKVVQKYPKSNKVPDALLKLGFVQLTLKNRIKAKEYLDYVIVAYPRTNAAKLAIRKKAKAAL